VQVQQVELWKWWVAFQQTPLIGPSRIQKLIAAYNGDLEAAWNAPAGRLSSITGERIAEQIVKTREQLDLNGIVARIENLGQSVIAFDDPRYPQLLRETTAPPLVLYVEGSIEPEDDLSIAVVGSRESTPYGRDVARLISGDLATGGVTVVSGLARGMDGVAHEAALAAGGRTIAVLAGGVDWIYPSEHKGLARRIRDHGALISEYPPKTRPVPRNFPARNRIMAGLSSGVVIVEARIKSGTLITANYAAHYNREVFAVPGSVLSPASSGCHHLLKEGACLATSAADILIELQLESRAPGPDVAEDTTPVTPEERAILTSLTIEPQHIDDLAVLLERPIHEVATALMLLELQGRVRNAGAQHYARIR